ncbi:hypothetical protein CS390_15260 [Pseudomonas sp. HLS-6]|nr:hypothetical protein CS390_15260 [Pseudomonas sp. HLS-6]
MVQADEMRKAFVARLKIALAANEIPERGAGARLAEIVKTTPKATSKWLNAESMPRGTNMRIVAEALKVRAEWLEYGVPPMRDGDPNSFDAWVGERMREVGNPHQPAGSNLPRTGHGNASTESLMAISSPRSQDALAKIIAAVERGRLTEEDIILLEQIATKIAGAPDAKNTNAKLREKLALDDPHPPK